LTDRKSKKSEKQSLLLPCLQWNYNPAAELILRNGEINRTRQNPGSGTGLGGWISGRNENEKYEFFGHTDIRLGSGWAGTLAFNPLGAVIGSRVPE